MNVTGTWLGEYTYGASYSQVGGTSVPFTLSLTESGGVLRKPRFVGYVRDDAQRGGQPERGRIDGVRRRRVVEFRKTMPAGYVFDAQGRQVPMRDHLLAQGFTGLPDEITHCIDYRGELDEHGDSMAGTWVIPTKQLRTDQGWLALNSGSASGTWTAKRRSALPSAI